MKVRWLIICLCLAGCRTPSRVVSPHQAAKPPTPTPAIQPIKHDTPAPALDGLDRAADRVQKGDLEGAVAAFKEHLREHPDQFMIRAYLAEVLFQMKKLSDAQEQYDRFSIEAQDADGPARKQLLHAHTRLMEIAQDRDDSYTEHLHRGIGLVLLVRQLESSGTSTEAEPGFQERLLCKAVTEFTYAKKIRPDEPRPHWYLAEVFNRMDQPRSAERALKQAKSLAALLPLPPAEQRALNVAR